MSTMDEKIKEFAIKTSHETDFSDAHNGITIKSEDGNGSIIIPWAWIINFSKHLEDYCFMEGVKVGYADGYKKAQEDAKNE